MRSCSIRVKKLIKVGLSEGGGVHLDLPLNEGTYHECCCEKKYCVSMRVLNLLQHLFVSFLKVLVGVETKNKPLVSL